MLNENPGFEGFSGEHALFLRGRLLARLSRPSQSHSRISRNLNPRGPRYLYGVYFEIPEFMTDTLLSTVSVFRACWISLVPSWQAWRKLIGYVGQEPVLFATTVGVLSPVFGGEWFLEQVGVKDPTPKTETRPNPQKP